MTRQLNLRVNDAFAERLERLSRKLGRSMGAVLEEVGTPAIEAAEEDIAFEAEALVAWEDYQLTGTHVTTDDLDALFDAARKRAQTVRAKQAE